MRLIRIGKDINISWEIFRTTDSGREPYALDVRDCSLRLVSPVGKILVEDFTIDGNVITWVFRGRDQRHTGEYSLELVQREGKDGMLTVDTCAAFKLVPYSCLEGEDDCIQGDIVSPEILRIRIGKDFTVRWRIFRREGGTLLPYDCTGKDLTLCLDSPYTRTKIEDFTVEGNLIEWTFKGMDQKSVGSYRLVLIENQGRDGMLTVDTCDAFELVAHSCEEYLAAETPAAVDADALSSLVETTTVDLESSFITGAVNMAGDVHVAPYIQGAVDTELSMESENPVANYVLTAEINALKEAVQDNTDAITTLTADINTEGSVDYKINRALGWIESL